MSWLICIAIIAVFLYYRRNKVVVGSNYSKSTQYVRLWLLPVFQFVVCIIIVLFSFAMLNFLLSNSPFMDQIISENLGVFSSIASDTFNDYRTEKLTPHIESMNNLHRYATYIFYISIVSLSFHIYVLKNKICSKQTVLGFAILLTVVILILDYYYLYDSSKGFSAFASTETLGLWGLFGKNENETIESSIDGVCTLGVVFFFLHYYHNIWLRQYYDEVDETGITSTESLTETDCSDEQSDESKKYQNLKDLKALLDAGILTQEEFDAQKKEILNGD